MGLHWLPGADARQQHDQQRIGRLTRDERTHAVDVSIGVWGGAILSTPPGIDYSANPNSGGHGTPVASFATGSSVQLCATPPSGTGLSYDVTWTGIGGCGGNDLCTTISLQSDASCHLELTTR